MSLHPDDIFISNKIDNKHKVKKRKVKDTSVLKNIKNNDIFIICTIYIIVILAIILLAIK